MALQKPTLLKQFRDIIDENIKNGAATSEQLRKGIPSSFTAADGREYRLDNVSRYYRTSIDNNTKTQNPTFLDIAKNKEVTQARADAIEMQTSPNVKKWSKTKDAVKGMEAHHKRMVKMYAPFYEGLSKKEAKELTQWFVDEGVPLGDAKVNLTNLSKKVHKEIHNWMKESNIQVLPDKTGKGNFSIIDKGKNKGSLFVKGSPGSGVRAVMPSFKDVKGVNPRLPAIANWLKYVQDPINEKLSELEWDEYRAKHPPKLSDQLQVGAITKEFASEGKLPKRLLQIGAGSLGTLAMGLPSQAAARDIKEQVQTGDNIGAAKTYGKDLLIGHSASRAMGSAMKVAQGKLAKTLGSNLARQALRIAGRQVVKKGAALATGPLAPAVMTGLLIKDAYDVANIISGDKLKFKTNQPIRGRSGANRDIRRLATQNIRNNRPDSL